MANSYDRGDTIRVLATFVSSGNLVVEVPSVYVFVRNPLGSVATYGYGGAGASVTRVGSGVYYKDIIPSCLPPDGVWTVRFDSGGGVAAAAGETAFNVRPTPFL